MEASSAWDGSLNLTDNHLICLINHLLHPGSDFCSQFDQKPDSCRYSCQG